MTSFETMGLEIENQDLSTCFSDDIIIKIFSYLPASSLLKVAQVSTTYQRLALDEMLWKDLFYRHWKVDQSISMAPGKVSWVQEYKRLYYHTPAVESEVVRSHTDEVLHVSFAHNGKMFATCSKDGFVKIWNNNSYPCSLKNQADMSILEWKHTAFSQFNESDTLILVSGPLSTNAPWRGGIAIFSLQGDFEMLNQVTNTGVGMFGTWYNDCFFLSGNPSWWEQGVSCSHIWLQKTIRPMDFKDEPIMRRIFCFRTKNYSSIQSLMIANVFIDRCNTQDKSLKERTAETHANTMENKQSKSTISMLGGQGLPVKDQRGASDDVSHICKENSDQEEKNLKFVKSSVEENYFCIHVSDDLQTRQFPSKNDGHSSILNSVDLDEIEINAEIRVDRTSQNKVNISSHSSDLGIHGTTISCVNSQALTVSNENYPDPLIRYDLPRESDGHGISFTNEMFDSMYESQAEPRSFSADDHHQNLKGNFGTDPTGAKLFAKNEISDENSTSSNNMPDKYLVFMCGSKTYAPTHIGLKRFRAQGCFDVTTGQLLPNGNYDISHLPNGNAFDNIDHIYDMQGHIIGMCLSPDHRYLYVNSRKWKEVCQIDDPTELPPLVEEIDLHVFDLFQVKMVGKMNASHKAYSPSNNCFIISLDVCEDYVASGAEDNHGHIWDRHYRICFNKFPHSAVVNSVAFNPADPEMLVTVSDDFSVKIWRSRFSEDNLIKTNMKLTQCWKQEMSDRTAQDFKGKEEGSDQTGLRDAVVGKE